MPEKPQHPDTYESPTNIPTFIEGGTLDDKGSHEIEEISNLPKATTTNGVINLYVTSSHPESNFGGNVNVLNNLFDDIFSIEEVGVYKPDSKVYDIPVRKYKINKDEIAFLSANTWDVSGGGNYGYQAIWVNRNNNIFDNLDYKPTNEIKSLKELINLI